MLRLFKKLAFCGFLVETPAENVLSRGESGRYLTSGYEAGETEADATDICFKIFKIFHTITRRSNVKGHDNGEWLVFQAFSIIYRYSKRFS